MAAALARKRISREGVCVKGFEALQFNAGQGKAGRAAMNFNLGGCGMRHLLANFTIATLVLVSGAAGATPGATDANGCHQSAKMGYHCHAVKPGAAARKAEKREAVEERKRRRECKGRPNAGACLGYAS